MARRTSPTAATPLSQFRRATLELDATAPLRLDIDTDTDVDGAGWLIERGAVDLFVVVLADGRPHGARLPVCSVTAGQLLLALPPGNGHAVIAVGRLGTVINPLAWDDVSAWPPASFAPLCDDWTARLAAAAYGDRPAAAAAAAAVDEPVAVAAGSLLHASRGGLWIVPGEGRLSLLESGTAIAAAMPIAAGLAVQAEEDCVVECLATSDALARGLERTGLAAFHAAIVAQLGRRIEDEEKLQHDRMTARAAVDRRHMAAGLRQLAGIAGFVSPQAPASRASSPLHIALNAVAARQGVVLSRMPRFAGGAEPNIRSLARANGIGLRSVLLREEWWRRDSGALLGWYGEARAPVALLPDGVSYRAWDAAAGTSVQLDRDGAAEIAPRAIMLYRPLPDDIAGIGALLAFAARGLGRELRSIILLGLLAGALATLLPLATGYLFGSVVPRAERGQVIAVIIGLGLAALGAGVFDLSKAIALLRFEARLEAAMQPALVHRMLGLPVNFFRRFGTGELTNRVLAVQSMRRLLAGNTLVSLLSALFALTSLGVILFYSPLLALVATVIVGIGAAISAGLGILELRQEQARVVLRGREDGLLIQVLQGIAKLRVAAGEARVFAVWAELFGQQKRRFLAAQRYAGVSAIFAEIYPIVALLALFLIASRLLMPLAGERAPDGSLDLGGFLAINAAFGQLLAATTAMARAAATALELLPLFQRLRPIIAASPEARDGKSEAPPLSGAIELSHVTFRYTAGSRPVLDDVSLRIEPGAFAAFVGPSGSGKSTMLRLLLGFESAESGDVLYDGQSVSTLDTGSLRRQIGVVLQHCRIATGSIFDNITSGLPYTLDDAWAAARLAGIADDIEAMPMGMHTLLMEGSTTLSGGQRQRLMIARALIGRPRILLFDEATSALDNRSQELVMQSLERLSATRIVIAHRLSTVERADRIFVLERGRIIEEGAYAALIDADGAFSKLARRQIL